MFTMDDHVHVYPTMPDHYLTLTRYVVPEHVQPDLVERCTSGFENPSPPNQSQRRLPTSLGKPRKTMGESDG